MGNLPSTSGRVTQVAHEATQSSGGPVVVGKPGDPPARPGRIIWRIMTAGSQVTEDPHGTIVYLPGHLPKKSSTKCLGKYTMNGSYGQVFSNYGWFTFPFQMACINCINGYGGDPNYLQVLGPSKHVFSKIRSKHSTSVVFQPGCSSNFMVEGSSPSKWPKWLINGGYNMTII